jgi:succinate dehydrogenase / fumarate reductase, cytochrome b subunit
MQQQQRPRFLNLFKIRLPVTGVTSILHRICGALLFLAIPGLIFFFDRSLSSPESFAKLGECMASPLLKLLATLMAWALIHHLLAGIRYLLTDIAIGLNLQTARATAWTVNILSVAGLAVLILVWWL